MSIRIQSFIDIAFKSNCVSIISQRIKVLIIFVIFYIFQKPGQFETNPIIQSTLSEKNTQMKWKALMNGSLVAECFWSNTAHSLSVWSIAKYLFSCVNFIYMALISIFMHGNVQSLGLTCMPLVRGTQLRDAIMTNHQFRIICLRYVSKNLHNTVTPAGSGTKLYVI